MKKWIMAIVCLMTMVLVSSCGSTYTAVANYSVCYPDGTITNEFSTPVVAYKESKIDVRCYSTSGTNYISVFKDGKVDQIMTSTTAPMRLNYYKVFSSKNKKDYSAYSKSKGDDIYMSDILRHR